MAAEKKEERKSYIIVRRDNLLLHTKPVTRDEAEWLYRYAYNIVEDRGLRIRYLAEWGNVLDVSEYVERMARLGFPSFFRVVDFIGAHDNPEGFVERVNKLLYLEWLQDYPQVRQVIEEYVARVREFLKSPVRPRPIDRQRPTVYFEMGRPHVVPKIRRVDRASRVSPRPEWLSYRIGPGLDLYGISVFRDSIWLWEQFDYYVHVVAVRRDAADKDVIAALAGDEVVAEFLRRYGNVFREVLRENEAELVDYGYEDVVRKVKLVLAAYELLTAGRSEEEGVPA